MSEPTEDSRDNYVATLSEDVIAAAHHVSVRMGGTIASDLWPADQGHDEAAERRDYELLAQQWNWLHNASKLDVWDAAECWVKDFIDDVLSQ